MKNILFGLIATILFSITGTAQTKPTNEDNRLALAKSMLQMVTDFKTAYSKGDTFDTFSKKVSDPTTISTDATNVLKKAFGYIQNNTNDETILNEEKGVELTVLSFNYLKVKDKLTIEQYILGQNYTNNPNARFFGAIWHGIKAAVQWVGEQIELACYNCNCCSGNNNQNGNP